MPDEPDDLDSLDWHEFPEGEGPRAAAVNHSQLRANARGPSDDVQGWTHSNSWS
jgi:hypothetical protein